MSRILIGFCLMFAAGLLTATARQDVPPPAKKGKAQPKAKAASAIQFNPTPSAIVAGIPETLAVAISKDGKRVASGGGTTNPATGFISVVDTATKREFLSLRTPRQVNSVGLSPDGKRVAIWGQGGDLKVFDVDSGKTLATKKLDSNASQGAFSPDGKLLATVSQKSVQLWNLPSGEAKVKLTGATLPLQSVAFSADGRKLAVGGSETKQNNEGTSVIYVWDVATQKLEKKLEMPSPFPINSIALSPDGSTAVGVDIAQQVRIWDVAKEKVRAEPTQFQQVLFVGFAPDGKSIAAATASGEIRLWNPVNGQEIGLLQGHFNSCRCLAFAAGNNKLVSGGSSGSLKLWDVKEKQELATLREEERSEDLPRMLAMTATRDGSRIALAIDNKTIVLRDGRTGEIQATLRGHTDAVNSIAFSPDGKTLASGSTDKTIKLWDVAKAKELRTIHGHSCWVFAVAFSHDGKTLASGGYDRVLRFWDVETGKSKGLLEAHRAAIRAIAFSPDDTLIATGGSDRLVKIWSVEDRAFKHMMKLHQGAIRVVAFSPDSKLLASGDEDGLVKLWTAATGKEVMNLNKIHNEAIHALAFVDDQTLISGGVDGVIRQWDTTRGAFVAQLPGHGGGTVGLAVVPGPASFLSAGGDRIIKRFRENEPGPVRFFNGHTGVIQWTGFSPNGKQFVSCGHWPEGDKTLRVWDVGSSAEVLKIQHPGEAAMAAFSPNGRYIASVSSDSKAYLWDAATGDPVASYKGHSGGVNGLAFNKDGTRLLTSGDDKTVRVWDVETGREIQKFTGHTEMVRRVAFHPDGKHALSAGRDALVRMWELETGREVKQFKASGKWADCLDISKDGRYLATGGNTLRVYEIESGQMISECTGHQFGLTHVAFSNDASKLITAAYDGTARLWNRTTGKELYRFSNHREFLFCAAFSPDGQWILTGGGGADAGDGKWTKGTDHAVRLWKMPDEKMMANFSPDSLP